LADTLKADPQVKPLVENYQTKQAVSSGLLWGGLACTIGGIVIVGQPASYTSSSGGQVTPLGTTGIILAIVGDIAILTTPFITVSSYEDIIEGTNMYNRDQMKTFN
jgi:hypothetical protein